MSTDLNCHTNSDTKQKKANNVFYILRKSVSNKLKLALETGLYKFLLSSVRKYEFHCVYFRELTFRVTRGLTSLERLKKSMAQRVTGNEIEFSAHQLWIINI